MGELRKKLEAICKECPKKDEHKDEINPSSDYWKEVCYQCKEYRSLLENP